MLVALLAGHVGHLLTERDVVQHVEPRKDTMLLEDECGAGDLLGGQVDLYFTCGGCFEFPDDAQEGRLAASRRTQDACERPFLEVEVHVVKRMHLGLPGEDLGQIAHDERIRW